MCSYVLDLENRTATLKHYRLFLLLFHAIYSPIEWMNEDKNFGSPQEAFFTSTISWKIASCQLNIFFHFGTENWDEKFQKGPV